MARQTVETEQRKVDIVNLLLRNKHTIAELIKRVDGVTNAPQCYNILIKLEDAGYTTRNDKRYGQTLWTNTGKVYKAIEINRVEDTIHKDILGSVLKGNHTANCIKQDIGHCKSLILEALRELRSKRKLHCKAEGKTNVYTIPNIAPKKPMPVSRVSNAWAIPSVNYGG